MRKIAETLEAVYIYIVGFNKILKVSCKKVIRILRI